MSKTSPLQFVSYLRKRGIQLRIQQGTLRVRSVAGTIESSLVDEVSARKDELIVFLGNLTEPADFESSSIPHAPKQGELALSSGQRRLWIADSLASGSATYCLPFAYEIEGPVERTVLERALTEIVRRHEILRTRFSDREAEPFQTILPAEPVTATYLDFSDLSETDMRRSIEAVSQRESKTPFCLEAPPLFRATLIARAPEKFTLLFTIHHIVSDGSSMDVLKRELSALYVAFVQGKPSPLPELKLQYADYAAWQSEIDYNSGPQKTRLDYWRRTLTGAPALLDLPTNRPRTEQRTPLGRAVPVNISQQLSDRLAKLGRSEQCSLFMTSLALFAVLLCRYTGEEDICIGAPVAGRIKPELDDLIGFFVNSLVFRLDLSRNPSFRGLLRRVRERVVEALEFQDVPFDRVVEEMNPERTPAYSPLFQVAFAFRNSSRAANGSSDTYIREISASGTGTAMYDVTLHMSEGSGLLSGWLEYSCDLFDEEMVERMVQHYINLLEAVCDDADASIKTLPMLSAFERKKIVENWNETLAHVEPAVCIHDLIIRQALSMPDAIAVVDNRTNLTYSELDTYSNRIAHLLREQGCGPETLVAVCMQRSAIMMPALLGILKAGAAYVPIDPVYPDTRIRFILEDTTPAVVICDSSTLNRFEAHRPRVTAPSDKGIGVSQSRERGPLCASSFGGGGYSILALSGDWNEIAGANPEPPVSLSHPSDSAYLIYTSGSTGQPKGVQVEHRSVVAFLTFATKLFGDDLRTALVCNSMCFDASIMEMFGPLSVGGTLVVVGDVTQLLSVKSWFPSQITFALTVPSAMGELLHMPAMLEGIRTISLIGEPAPTSLVRQLYSIEGIERVYDVYGPTETTVFSTYALREPDGVPTVGHPIDNTRIYILDPEGNPVPVGIPGELFIAGSGVSRGYWRRPELTGKRYVHDPFSTDEISRMYRTGDQARYRSDGNIELLGRLDDQVKVRGYRIELGEVEHVLLQHPAVRDCGTAVARFADGIPRLVACISPKSKSPTPDDIRQFASKHLPGYMTPSNVFVRESVPRTTSGKIDRKLIAGFRDAGETKSIRTGPKNSIEAELLKIWSALFPDQVVGTKDNFFDLGGHSLLALRMLHRIEVVCRQKLSLSVFFHAQTIEALATYIHPDRAFATWKSLVPLRTTGSLPPLFLIHGSGGNLLSYKPLLQALREDQPVYGLQYSEGSFDPARLPFVESLAAEFLLEIKQVQPRGPYHLLGHCAGGSIAYEMACQLAEEGEVAGLVGLLDVFAQPYKLRFPIRVQRRVALFKEHIHVILRDETRFRYLESKLRRVAREVAVKIRRMIAPETRSLPIDLEEATLFFTPRKYPGAVHLFASPDSATEHLDVPPDYGWSRLVTERVSIHHLPGNHLTLLEAPHVQVLSDLLTKLVRDGKSAAVA